MRKKKLPKPAWYKNTYFWLAGILVVVALVGLVSGENSIRDPGQKRETGLVWMYLAGAAIMFANGYMSHKQTVAHYEVFGEEADAES